MDIFKKIIFIICMFSTAHFTAFAQGISVSGTITDETNEPIPGVSIVVKGTTIGMASMYNGTYQITVPSEESVLRFSYLGYSPVEIVVGSQRIINVTMREDVAKLEEVVVVGYGTQKKASVTSAISSVQTSELLKSPTTSLGNALAGRLPGLSAIQYSGLPGYDDPTIYVRGVGTLNASNSSPLILVDGVERPFTQLDPNEVADISILKDAGSTAVFGVRGANGVILVTTKRGESGKAKVTASASWGLQQPTKIVEFADSYLYATTYNEAQRRDGLAPEDYTFQPETVEHYRLGDQPVLYPSVDWMSYIMKEYAWQNQVNVNVSGGNDRARYFVSISQLSQDGLFKTFAADPRENFRYKRYNYRANLDIDLTKSTLLGLTLGGRIEDRTEPNGLDHSGVDSPYREGTLFRYLVEAAPMSGAGIVDGKHITYNRQLAPLPLGRDGLQTHYARGFRNDVSNVVNFDLKLTQKLDFVTPGLEANLKGAYNNRYMLEKVRPTNNDGMMGVPTYYPHPVRDPATNEITGYVLEKRRDSQVLTYDENYSYARDWYFEASLNYNRRFAEVHNVTALLLYNQSKNYYPGWDRPTDYTDIPKGYVGLVGRITYDYKLKYLMDLNMGYNGSENFAQGKRYGVFPSASVGWVITEEDFMQEQNIFNHLKLRYSFGIVGNDGGVGRFLYLPASYSYNAPRRATNWDNQDQIILDGTQFGIFGQSLLKPNVREASLGNPNVSWEKARKQNFGVDLRTVKNKLGIIFDYFTEHRWDILISPTANIPHHFALPNVPNINFGVVDNWGYEFEFKWTDRIGSDFEYTIAPNMSFSRNKRVEMLEIPPAEPYLRRTGTKVSQPFGYALYSFYYNGIENDYLAHIKSLPGYIEYWEGNKDNYDKDGNLKPYTFPSHGVDLKPGDCVFLDLNYDGKIDAMDQHAIGYPNYPEYFFGLNLNLKFKRFEFSMLLIGATNTDRDLAGAYRPPFGQQNNAALIKWVAENSWTETNPNMPFPRITFANRENNTLFSEVYLQDASYIRLKNLEFAYNFNMSRVPYIENCSLFATGYNLLTFSKYKANDPETSGAGWQEFFRYPPTRVFNLGLRVTF